MTALTAESFVERLKSRMSGSFVSTAPKRTDERTRKVVRTNRWDDRVWREARKTTSVDHLVEDLSIGDEHRGGTRGEFEPAPELVEGLFQSFYKANPVLEDKRRLERDLYPVRKILEEVRDNPKLKELQDFTMGDPVMATVAIDAMAEQIREIIGRVPPPPPPPQPGGGQQGNGGQPGGQGEGDPQGQGHPGKGEAEGEGEGQSEGDPGAGDAPTEFDPDSEEAMEQAEAEWEAEYDKLLDEMELDRLANKMLDAAEQEASELDNLRRGIGLDNGEWLTMSPDERLKMADRLRTPQMKALADIVGQMKRFALGVKATRINDVPHEAYDVESGNIFNRLLKAQFALLGDERTKYEFYRRYTERELLQFKMRGSEEVGRGPVVVCIDKSGSMDGGPMMWAMGVAEALRRFAADEDRDYYALFFGYNEDRVRFEFPQGKGPFEKVLTFLSTRANGGTAFDGVLTEALERASKQFDAGGKGKADIIFITDGMAHLAPEWIEQFNAERKRVGVRLYSVYIGGAYDMSYQQGPAGLLNQISDAVIPVTELKPEAVKQIFQKV